MKTSKLAVALALAGAISAGGVAGYRLNNAPGGAMAAHAAAAERPVRALPDFSALVEQNGPAVVNISVTQASRMSLPEGGPPTRGQGSGFIVSADGLVLTNAHVVDGATDVNVKLTDKREFRAKVIGKDARSDIAVLKIDAKGLPTVKLGDPGALRAGEWVVAIGAPFGFENSVTAGIVSAKGRSLPDESLVPFIQTDVAVNPGNSGGPLFNLAGEVVGVNSQIYSQTGGYQGLSFAIPIDLAMKVKDQLVTHGRVTRGYLGVMVQPLTRQLADAFGLKKAQGALVAGVQPGSPAAKAGLRAGDVILAVGGKAVADSAELAAIAADTMPGTRAQLEVWRGKATRQIVIAVEELRAASAEVTAAGEPVKPEGRLGLTVRTLTPEEQREAGAAGGLLVEQAGGVSAKAGIQPGDLLLSINGTALRNAGQLRDLIGKAGSDVALLVQRGDARLFIPVTLG